MAVELDDYDRANRLAATMVQTSRKTRDRGLQADVQARAKQAQEMRSAFNAAKPALAKLEADAANAPANAAWGRYVAWVKDNWDEGLPLLAKGGDDVAAIAARELAGPKTPDAQVPLADDWSETAQGEKGQRQRSIEEHACRWYERAAGELPPADRQAVLKKIERSFGNTAIHELDTAGSGIELGGAEANIGPEATIEFWAYTQARDVPLLTKRQREDDQSLTFYMSGGQVSLISDGPYQRFDIRDASSAPIDDGRWHHVAAVKRGKSLWLMVDGRLAGSGEGLELFRSQSPWILGVHRPWNNSQGQGRFCRVRLSTIARYRPPFKPDRTYERDQYTAWMR
ncbi:MAG TPA: LamG-like jellyroll fold domain-containing protein [Pirellulales bacterium]|nr:LamG-like jellyroll fold domain-containing protein [Pirellulales bacterium]